MSRIHPRVVVTLRPHVLYLASKTVYLYGDLENHRVSLKEVASQATLRFGVEPYTNQFTISVAKVFSLLFSPLLLIVPFYFFRFVVLRCLGIINERECQKRSVHDSSPTRFIVCTCYGLVCLRSFSFSPFSRSLAVVAVLLLKVVSNQTIFHFRTGSGWMQPVRQLALWWG